MSLRVNFNSFNYGFKSKIWDNPNSNSGDSSAGSSIGGRETYVTWRYDESGNIVYYTIDKSTGEILDSHKYKNPAQL